MDRNSNPTEMRAELAAMIAAKPPVELAVAKNAGYVVVPDDYKLVDLEAYNLFPRQVRAAAAFNDADGFERYFNRFREDTARMFGDIPEIEAAQEEDGRAITVQNAVLTGYPRYHATHAAPAWAAAHEVKLVLKPSEALRAWVGRNGKAMNQAAFADFLEDRLGDLLEPAPAKFLTLIREVRAVKKVTFRSVQRVNTGDNEVEYTEDTRGVDAGGRVGKFIVPEEFTIMIPLARYGELVHLKARLP